MKECSKSINRRMADSNFMNRYFSGNGIDIGGAPDPLFLYSELFPKISEVRTWDLGDGDATFMEGVENDTYDFVHSSHCLEHLKNPEAGLKNWFRILKPNGYLIVTVPDEDLYEQGVFPSTFNTDHKCTFTISKKESWSTNSINIFDILPSLGEAAEVVKVELLNHSYRYVLPRFDQTLTPVAEAGIEFVVRKRPQEEVAFCGLHKHPGEVDGTLFQLLTGIKKPTTNKKKEEV